MLRQLTIGKRLALLPLCALAGIVLLAVILLRNIGAVYESASYSTVNTVPSLLVIDRAADAMTAIRMKTWEYVASLDSALLSASLDKIASATVQLDGALKDYEPLISDDKDNALLQVDHADRDALIELSQKAIALSNADKRSEATELLVSRRAAFEKSGQDIDEHRRYNEILGKQGASDAEAVKSHALLFGILLVVLTMGVIGLLGYFIARHITTQLGGEPADVAAVAGRVAIGDFSSDIRLSKGDCTSLYAAVAKMQEDLRIRQETDRAAAAEKECAAQELLAVASDNARIRTALDRVTVGAMLADNDGRIIYTNDFARDIFRRRTAEIRTQLPNFDPERILDESFDMFHRSAAHQRSLLSGLTGTHTADLKLGGASLRITANPVVDAQGQRLGTVVQWNDRTQEVSTEEEVSAAVKSAVDGDLTMRISEEGKDGFFKTLAQGMNVLIGNMADVVQQMAVAAGEVNTGADEISRGNLDLSQRTEEQASSLEQTAASMEQMTTIVKNNADNASQANQLAEAAREHAERGGKVVGTAVSAMHAINTASRRIADIIGVIDDIAFQTNLLALNAAVEAARAGEQGRGFAVVASEVRNLASRSADAAKEIKTLIQDSVNKVDEGAILVDESGKVLAEIVSGVQKVTDVMAEITVSSHEQASGIEQVNKAVSSMDSVTQQNAALVEQASAASQTLTEQAANLLQLISRYKYTEASAAGARLLTPPLSAESKIAAVASPQIARSELRSQYRPWSAQAALDRTAISPPTKAEGTTGNSWAEF